MPRGRGWIMRELIGKLPVPRRVQASMVSLNFYCPLAEAYALLAWWAAPGAGAAGEGPRGAQATYRLRRKLGRFQKM